MVIRVHQLNNKSISKLRDQRISKCNILLTKILLSKNNSCTKNNVNNWMRKGKYTHLWENYRCKRDIYIYIYI